MTNKNKPLKYFRQAIGEMTEKLNLTPFKQINWKLPKEMMIEMIKNYA
ncbi:hypothetical protein [Lutibacter sp.]